MRCSKVLTTCAMLLLLAPAFAQRGEGKAKIPFDFQIGNQTLAAGDYRVKAEGVKLQVRSTNGSDMATVFTMTVPGDGAVNVTPQLVFHRYGNKHFLAEAWLGASDRGNRLFTSQWEFRLARIKPQSADTVAMAREK